MPTTTLQQHGGNVKALVFSTIDFAEGQPREESLCIRFGTPESKTCDAQRFCHMDLSRGRGVPVDVRGGCEGECRIHYSKVDTREQRGG